MIAILASVMIAIFALWEAAERLLWGTGPPAGGFLLVRGMATAVVMAVLAAWLMARYRGGYEEALRRQSDDAQRMRRFFENIVQDAGEAIISFDARDVVQTWNRAAEAIYGYTAAEMIGQSLLRLVPSDLVEAGEPERLLEQVARDGFVRNHETRRLRKDGSAITVRITRSALRDAAGRLTGSTAIVSDITAEKEMARRLIHAEKLAAIGQAAASIAHEVRNALAGISGAIQVLKGSAAWKELPEGVGQEVDLQVGRIAHIVNDLLTYARPGTIRPQRSDVHRILDRALASASAGADAAGKRVVRAFEPGPIVTEVDPAWLEQAFGNVITNAYQAMGEGGILRVATKRDNGTVRIAFEDTGCGMSDDVRARAFEPFFTTKVRGTGLGLPIVRAIIEAHRGSVRLASAPRHGTTLVLDLPLIGGHHH
jgi:PAS domain S-box-containing protein